ncbi:MAG TPA: serpin family protein [Bacteroidales bacterium]|nr:serpin family protein [Bacteroidales bacterium]
MKKIVLISGIVLFSVYACKTGSETPAPIQNTDVKTEKPTNNTKPNHQTNTMQNEKNHAESGVIKNDPILTEGMTSFAFDFFEHLYSENQGSNYCFSPVSLNVALGMVYIGARNQTRSEMSQTLGFPVDTINFINQFSIFYQNLKRMSTDTALEFNLANRIFMEQTYQVLDSYRSKIVEYFDGAFETVDFLNQVLMVEQRINTWVEEMTKTRIKNLIPRGTLSNDTRMVLVNAIYIKSKWKYAFDEKLNKKKDFNVSKTEKTETEYLVKRQEGIKFFSNEQLSAIELNYTSTELSLILIKPHKSEIDNIDTYIPNAALYNEILRSIRPHEVYMEIPKFKIESSFSLADPLIEKGMKEAFSGNSDFTGISSKGDLAIDEVLQKVFFEIDEKGSEAAAATAIIMRTTSSAVHHEAPKLMYFIADRPFIFILKENTSHTPLFVGMYVKP